MSNHLAYTIITMGFDCSPASALKSMGMREFSLPFDWVQSNIQSIKRCFEDGFAKFHTNLQLNQNKTRLIDEYGIQYPHEYPVVSCQKDDTNLINEDMLFPENKEDHIIDNWMTYYSEVKEKYNRRIERFKSILKSHEPIVVLCRYNTSDVIQLQQLFQTYFEKDNIFFVNSSPEVFSNSRITNVWTEKNNVWNDIELWKKSLDIMMDKVVHLYAV